MSSSHKVFASGGTASFSRAELEAMKRTAGELRLHMQSEFVVGYVKAQNFPVRQKSVVAKSISIWIDLAPAADETITITVKRNRAGTKLTMLSAATYVITNVVYPTAALEKDLTAQLAVSPVALIEGDTVEITMTYSAGGAPTPVTESFVCLQLGPA